ncbi:MAG: DNA-3-methyladenine glycosylase [Acidimicrobiales bacterium]
MTSHPVTREDLASTDVVELAPRLLGLTLKHGCRAGRIVEVEAYAGADDPASHAFRGPTPRTEVMFGPPGRLYVYRSYGIHWCANIVCRSAGEASAVLVRAVEPVAGIDSMWSDRPKAKVETDLASGPGKLCAALAIDHRHNGVDLLDQASEVRLLAEPDAPAGCEPDFEVLAGPRVGITKAVDRPWRFGIANNPHVSRPGVVRAVRAER